ncbi:MAG: ATP synthase F1 subunit gamma [Bacteroidota bacterium]
MSGNLKEVRTRIKSVNNTKQITKAMKMVSAAKLRRAQMAITSMRPYADKLNAMLTNIVSNMDAAEISSEVKLAEERDVRNVLIVLVTSNRGLCGAFNANLQKQAIRLIQDKYKAQYDAGNVTMMPIGKKGYDFFRKRYDISYLTDDLLLFDDLVFDNTAKVSSAILDKFINGTYDAVEVVYARFRNAAVQYFEAQRFLPIPKIEKDEEAVDSNMVADFTFEPSKPELLATMVPSILKTQFHSYLLDTHASEHGARMTAMDKASENADELLKELKITYNKARQEAITKELTEIVSGAAALEG